MLTPADRPATITKHLAPGVIDAHTDELALWCAGSDMLTTLTIRIHDQPPPDAGPPPRPDAPDDNGTTDPEAVQTLLWDVTQSGPLVAQVLDYGATPLSGTDLVAGRWRVHAAVWNRGAAEQLEDQLADEDEAVFSHQPDERHAAATGPQLGPELWELDLSPEPA